MHGTDDADPIEFFLIPRGVDMGNSEVRSVDHFGFFVFIQSVHLLLVVVHDEEPVAMSGCDYVDVCPKRIDLILRDNTAVDKHDWFMDALDASY